MSVGRKCRPINGNDPFVAQLANQAKQLHKLMPVKLTTRGDEGLAATLDLYLGALHALILARQHGFRERSRRKPSLAAIRADAERLAHREQRIDGPWLAGYYFNDGLFRVSAVYHRSLQLVVYPFRKGDNYVDDLLPEVLRQRGPWEHDSIAQVHDEVNTLKHVPGGLVDGRTVGLKTAIRGSVQLLRLLEAWREGRRVSAA